MDEALAGIIALLLGIGLLLLIIFYNISLQKAMGAVRKKNRLVDPPGLIWLNFIPIPFLNSVWTMIYGILACSAINKDADKKIAPMALSIIYPIVQLIGSYLIYTTLYMPQYGYYYYGPSTTDITVMIVFNLAGIVLWIVFWTMLVSATNKLKAMNLSELASGDDILDADFTSSPQTKKKNTSQSNDDEKIKALKEYKQLLDDGVLTQEEFDKKKQDLLD